MPSPLANNVASSATTSLNRIGTIREEIPCRSLQVWDCFQLTIFSPPLLSRCVFILFCFSRTSSRVDARSLLLSGPMLCCNVSLRDLCSHASVGKTDHRTCQLLCRGPLRFLESWFFFPFAKSRNAIQSRTIRGELHLLTDSLRSWWAVRWSWFLQDTIMSSKRKRERRSTERCFYSILKLAPRPFLTSSPIKTTPY